MPKISVLIPTYNRVVFLKRAIESVLQQSFQDFEIIVSDNCSTDNTEQMLLSLQHPKIKYYKNANNMGAVQNYNISIGKAQGSYIYFFSDDDIMAKNNLEVKNTILDQYHDVGMVHSNIRIIDENDKIQAEKHWGYDLYPYFAELHPVSGIVAKENIFKILFKEWNVVSMPSVLMRKSLITQVGIFNEKLQYLIDWDLWLRASLFAEIYYEITPLVDYRIHGKNEFIKMNTEIFQKECFLMKKILFDEYPSHPFIEKYTNEFLDNITHSQIEKYTSPYLKQCTCTIITADYLDYALSLNHSLLKYKDIPFYILVVDTKVDENAIISQFPNTKILYLEDINSTEIAKKIIQKYQNIDNDALRWSLKSVLVHHL